jgi:KaiC/GvpD/RAD55 family RecA-like ATPase
MSDLKRVGTGIKGFDKLVEGGFPAGKAILLSGTPGCGKTIFALQFLYNGATQFRQKGLYITFEEEVAHLKRQASQFGWDFDALEKRGMVSFLPIPSSQITAHTPKEILRKIEAKGYERVVIDSLSTLAINTPTTFISEAELTEIAIQRFMYYFVSSIRQTGATSLLISQAHQGQLSRDGVSEFICDGIIHIAQESIGGQFSRSLIVKKMRETKNDEDIHPLEISQKGLVVHTMR